ncbi:hypothetical protein HO173_002877 [Letharia columbiana]|uniref:Rhodopsin domain-containing protein n=1 Tax=Letharia columbiana TaxID=112416 RepID=A0A8H6G223_9LECA|nr:uncharacterized protein HO173_002877 [Letharia columbiana]KAF6239005.1 hypothetical protein HO173_002877 [Letharia columbiana]
MNFLFYTATATVFIAYCIPRPGENWPSITSLERCQKSESIAYVQGPFGVLSDIYIFILPLPVLWRLQMTLRKKLGVSSIFLVGFMYVHFKPVSTIDPISIIAFTYQTPNWSRAILASILAGMYYRVVEARSSDLTWRLPPTIGLADGKFLKSGTFSGALGKRSSMDPSRSNDRVSEHDRW